MALALRQGHDRSIGGIVLRGEIENGSADSTIQLLEMRGWPRFGHDTVRIEGAGLPLIVRLRDRLDLAKAITEVVIKEDCRRSFPKLLPRQFWPSLRSDAGMTASSRWRPYRGFGMKIALAKKNPATHETSRLPGRFTFTEPDRQGNAIQGLRHEIHSRG